MTAPTAKEGELLPCPFCGSDDIIITSGVAYNAKCHGCYARHPGHPSSRAAAVKWNARTQSPQSDLVELLKHAPTIESAQSYWVDWNRKVGVALENYKGESK